jgi:hypothetical protein
MFLPDILNEDILLKEEIQIKKEMKQLMNRIKRQHEIIEMLKERQGQKHVNREGQIRSLEADVDRNINELIRLKARYPYLGKARKSTKVRKS